MKINSIISVDNITIVHHLFSEIDIYLRVGKIVKKIKTKYIAKNTKEKLRSELYVNEEYKMININNRLYKAIFTILIY